MIRYPKDIQEETHALAAEFCGSSAAAALPEDNDVWAKAIGDYVYEHCSERAKAFLDDVREVQAYADKHELKV